MGEATSDDFLLAALTPAACRLGELLHVKIDHGRGEQGLLNNDRHHTYAVD